MVTTLKNPATLENTPHTEKHEPGEWQSLEASLREAKENTQAVLQILQEITTQNDLQLAIKGTLDAVKAVFGWDYGSYWQLHPKDHVLKFALESGYVTPEFQQITQMASFREGEGLSGRTWKSRDIMFVSDLGTMTDCCRREPAQKAGVKSGVCFPIIVKGQVQGTMDFFSFKILDISPDRLNILRSVGQWVSAIIERINMLETQKEETANAAAMNQVLMGISEAISPMDAAKIALDTVKTGFNWTYGSYWQVDPIDNTLKFVVESGSVAEEFRRVTRQASFKEGVGLSGRAWKARELLFVEDLSTLTDCCRREPAQKAGIKSGICFPIMVKGNVVGTMDFFSLETLQPSQNRLNTLRSIGQLVSSAVAQCQKLEQDKKIAEQLRSLDSALFAKELDKFSNNIYEDAQNSAVQANSISAASEQVSSNIQTVATASGELSHSITEIAKNAIQAANITEKAELKAEESQKIVDIVNHQYSRTIEE